jgi:heme-based aerotactic transducer
MRDVRITDEQRRRVDYEGLVRAIAEDTEKGVRSDGGVASEGAPTGETAGTSPQTVGEAVDEVVDRTLSVLKISNLDQQIAMDTYLHSYTEQIETELERQQSVAEDIDDAVRDLQRASEDVATSAGGTADPEHRRDLADDRKADRMIVITEDQFGIDRT